MTKETLIIGIIYMHLGCVRINDDSVNFVSDNTEQTIIGSNKVYTSIEEALKEPQLVFKLDLSNQKLSNLPERIALAPYPTKSKN